MYRFESDLGYQEEVPAARSGHSETRYEVSSNGAPCKGGRKGLKPGATQGAPRYSRQSAVVARMAACHSCAAETPHRVSLCPSIRQQLREYPPHKTCAAARARRAKPGAKRRQAGAQRPVRQGGLRVGVGGAVQSNQTRPASRQPPPTTSAAAPPTRQTLIARRRVFPSALAALMASRPELCRCGVCRFLLPTLCTPSCRAGGRGGGSRPR